MIRLGLMHDLHDTAEITVRFINAVLTEDGGQAIC